MKRRRKNISTRSTKAIRMSKGNSDGDGIEQYVHGDKKRPYNPPVGLVTPETDREVPKRNYSYDPYLDPQLQWTGKAEHTSFDVDTVSLHVHERIDPLTIIEKLMVKEDVPAQMSLFHYFEKPENNPPLREAIQFYKHNQNWSNRLIAGDSLLVMNSLLRKENMAGKVQMIYIDPPYGIKYGSNFQPFVNKHEVKDSSDNDLTQEPEMVKAFRDTWELGIHSYLTYLRDRLLLARELLTDSGSIFVQISDENIHHARELMDEVFGVSNFVSMIAYSTTSGLTSKTLSRAGDYLLWYCKNQSKLKYRQLFVEKLDPLDDPETRYDQLAMADGKRRSLTSEEKSRRVPVPFGSKIFSLSGIDSQGSAGVPTPFEFQGTVFEPPIGRHWTANYPTGMERLRKANRLAIMGKRLRYVRYFSDFPFRPIHNIWLEIAGSVQSRSDPKVYAVQTGTPVIARCMLMSTDPGDLVLDPTCGSGTTAYVSEQWGRRWITCDTSRVAIALAKQRIMTAVYSYYELAHADQGVSGGFKYETVPHITLKSIANNEPPEIEVLYDQPLIDKSKARVSGPLTVEAVPSQRVVTMEEIENTAHGADSNIARTGESSRTDNWINELRVTGIRGVKGKEREKVEFARLEPLGATRYLHAEGESKELEPKRVVISFGSAYAPLEQRQVALAIEEAQKLVPKPRVIIFASFQFDPEAAKDIDELDWPGVAILKVQMNTDLLTEDLKKKRSSNESFWLVGQPDVEIEKKGKDYMVRVNGFDYYNPITGEIESGDISKIAMWMLDTDYDGWSLYPRQIFFPMAGSDEGWGKLAKNLKVELDEQVLDKMFKGKVSLPFTLGDNKRVGVKIIDDRGIESLRIIEVKD